MFQSAGEEKRALDMYTDMRMFDKAQQLLAGTTGDTQKQLIRKRADWAQHINEPKLAAEMYISAGDYDKAIQIAARNGWTDMCAKLGHKDLMETLWLFKIFKKFSTFFKAYA